MWVIYPLIFLAGFVDSIAGGGGLISLTSYLAVGVPAHLALGTNKFSAVIGTGISSARFAKGGYVRWDSAITAFLGALIGSALGARSALLVDERALTWMMIFFVPAVAILLLLRKDFGTVEKKLPQRKIIFYSLLIGVALGFYDGFFGPGTGTFLIMAFTMLLGVGVLTACGNAKMVNFASNLAAAVTFIINGSVDYKLGIPCALCGMLGNYLGSGLTIKKGAKLVRPMMLAVIGLLLLKVIWDLFG